MASYPEYSATMPAQDSHDFELYPHQETYQDFISTSQPFVPSSGFSASYNHSMCTFDSFAPTQAFSDVPRIHHFGLGLDSHLQDPKAIYNLHSPAGSPAHSAAHSFDIVPPILSSASESGASVHSTSTSAMGSPAMPPQQPEAWDILDQGLGIRPGIVDGTFTQDFFTTGAEFDSILAMKNDFVDPTLIQPFSQAPTFSMPSYDLQRMTPPTFYEQPPSPAASILSMRSERRVFKKSGSQSPYLHTASYHPYTRRPSVSSVHSHLSQNSRRSGSFDEEGKEKGICPRPDCGRSFKDLKAHMLTHQEERPEKCPIVTCPFYTRGFARKYDKNRHTLTHYKGTMVCGFCPGSGSASEKSFNRADVFKRHLTSVHGVEQNPPNSRRKSPASNKKSNTAAAETTGTCSTCSVTFANAQEFYEHLDECVLRVVQQADPTEAVNQHNLQSVRNDKQVQETLDKHHLASPKDEFSLDFDNDDMSDDEEEDDAEDTTYGARTSSKAGKGSIKSRVLGGSSHVGGGNGITKPNINNGKRVGLTYSKGGVALTGSSRKKRKNYPLSWGCPMDKMKMKKRVLCVYDGPRRLWKDDMMLDSELEVRIRSKDGKSYVTDLDVMTLRKADALHNATDAEKGRIDENGNLVDIEKLMA